MSQLSATAKESARDCLKEFLQLRSEVAPIPQHCDDCGSLLAYFALQFWLDGDDEGWNIPVPFCLQCHPELALRVVAAA